MRANGAGRQDPGRSDRAEVGQAPLRDEAGQPGQQAEVHRHRGRHRPGRRRRRRPRWASWATTSSASASRTRPRRAHTIAAQGGINAAKNYHNDGDSIYRLFYDTVKGGDFRAREANVYRLAADQRRHHRPVRGPGRAVRPRVRRPARQPLVRRRAGLAHLLRPRPDRPAAAARRLPGAGDGRSAAAASRCIPRTEMLDLVVVDGRARGIVTRDLVTGKIESPRRRRGGARHRRLRQRLLPLDQRQGLATPPRSGARYKRGAAFANPCYTQIHPTCIPVSGDYQSKLTLMSESLRNDGRVWVPKTARATRGRRRRSPRRERDYYLERKYPSFGNLAPRDIASRAAKEVCDEGRGVGPGGLGVYLDFADAIKRLGEADDPRALRQPVRDVPADHRREPLQAADADLPGGALHHGRAVGGLQPDEHDPGLFVLGEANFSDHGANRLGASALMQGLADGYFVLPYTIGDYLAQRQASRRSTPTTRSSSEVEARGRGAHSAACSRSTASARSTRSTASWASSCGTTAAWRATRAGLQEALERIPELREEFWQNVNVPGSDDELNQALEKAGRVADFLEFGELMCLDALHREESCGGHFREEYQTEDGEALRDDEHFAYVAAWEYTGDRRAAGAAQGAAGVRGRAPGAAELQMKRLILCTSGGRPAPGRAGPDGATTRPTTSVPTCRSSRCSTWSTSA